MDDKLRQLATNLIIAQEPLDTDLTDGTYCIYCGSKEETHPEDDTEELLIKHYSTCVWLLLKEELGV